MSATMTFTQLIDDVKRYLERGDSVTTDPTVYVQIPRLINLAERRIARELKVQGFIEVVTDVMTPGQAVYVKPDRWRDTVSFRYLKGSQNDYYENMFARSYEYLREYRPDTSEWAAPQFYADYDYSHWLFAPTPDQAYPFEVVYYALPRMLDGEHQTNWLTDYAPQLLLYATLLEASPFLKNDERVATWQNFYDRAASALNGEDIGKILDRAAVRKEA